MNFFKELQRRKVIRAAVVYVVTAWVLIQVAGEVADPLRLPDWFSTAVIVLLALGFPVALGLAWAFEVKPDASSDQDESATAAMGEDAEKYLITRRSVAVLPFENVSDDTGAAHVATGLTEETLKNLSKMQELKVASRASTLAYKDTSLNAAELGEALGVSYLVEGTLRKLEDELRITTQLIRAPDDEHIWAQTFERDVAGGFAMQEALAQIIARQTQANINTDVSILAARRQTADSKAYRHFRIAAEERWQQVSGDHTPNWKLVLENYRRAVELDPDFAVAHEGIANVCVMWFELGMSREDASHTAHAALARAMALRPPSGFTYFHLAQVLTLIDANYAAAMDAVEKGLALSPNLAWLHMFLHVIAIRQGRLSDAIKHAQTAIQLSPGDSQINHQLANVLWARGDVDGAIRAIETSLENMSGGLFYVVRKAVLAMLYLERGQADRANHVLDSVLHAPRQSVAGSGALCLALARSRRLDEAQDVKAGLLAEYGSRWFPARFLVHLGLCEIDEAFYYLKEGIRQRHLELMHLRLELPFLEPLREDARWQDVMAQAEELETRAAAGQ